jgi:hypothetical protein
LGSPNHRARSVTLLPVSARAYRGPSPISGRTGVFPSPYRLSRTVPEQLGRCSPADDHRGGTTPYGNTSLGRLASILAVNHYPHESNTNWPSGGRTFPPELLGLPWYQSKSLVGLSHKWMDGHILPAGVPVIPISDRTRWVSRKRRPQAPAAAMPTTDPGSYPDNLLLASGSNPQRHTQAGYYRITLVIAPPAVLPAKPLCFS